MIFLKQDENMYKLLEALFYKDGTWVRIDELVDDLDLSKKTIHNYICSLEKLFKNYAKFEMTSNLVKADFILDIGLKTIKKIFIKNALISQILTITFLDEMKNKKDLATRLNTSDSSIFRNIGYLNEAIKEIYNIEFSYADLDFVGDEYDIEKFYLNLFISTQISPLDWPFEGLIDEKDVTTIAESIGKSLYMEIIFGQYSYIKTALAISLIRYRRGFKFKLGKIDQDMLSFVKKCLSNIEVARATRRLLPDENGDLTMVLYQILAFFINHEYTPYFKSLDEIFEIVPIYKDYYAYLYDKSIELCDKYGIDKTNLENAYKEIFSYFYVRLFNVEQADFFVAKSQHLLNYIKFINIDFYKDIYAMMDGLLDKYPNLRERYSTEATVYAIYSTWPGLLGHMIDSVKPAKAVIISNYDRYHSRLIQDFINSTASTILSADIYTKPRLDINWLKDSEYEVIITDFLLEADLGDKLLLNLENLPRVNRSFKILDQILSKKFMEIKTEYPEFFDDPRPL
ncbi:helix-turn-helix domain-containing protein [Anaerococcus sp. Marseille-P3915]|uniref:helix-turn-helix domain-containing protein n=1 Tax=Anaerococcus sp. Marseille-P3915 TaxID=2057799 RepID=UPI000D0B3810|nr:helix-turn-helix domain-containing protein [Anaerococcus sp. Marseille-P3915]